MANTSRQTEGYHINLSEIIYLNDDSMQKSMNGTDDIKALGNHKDRRVFYKDAKKSELKLQALHELAKTVTPVFPFAVVLNNKVYNKDDDHCTRAPNRWWGVDIVETCLYHDYCYYQIADFKKHKDSMKKAFNFCHKEFLLDLKAAKKAQRRHLPVPFYGSLFYLGVRYIPMSFRNFRQNQDKGAILNTIILKRAMEDSSFKKLIEESKLLDLKVMKEEVLEYCRVLPKNLTKKYPQHIEHPRDNLNPGRLFGCDDVDLIRKF